MGTIDDRTESRFLNRGEVTAHPIFLDMTIEPKAIPRRHEALLPQALGNRRKASGQFGNQLIWANGHVAPLPGTGAAPK